MSNHKNNKEKNITVPIDHNHKFLNEDRLKKWEIEKGDEYLNYRKQWHNNPKNGIVNDVPIHLDIEATSACNMKCIMCPRTDMLLDGTFWKVKNFNFDTYKKIVDQSTLNGNLKSIKFQYLGEPLVNKHLVKMIKYAKSKGVVDIMFNTNAALLNEKKSEEIINSGVDKVFFSFDSPYREKYNKIRIGGDYDQVLNNIKNFMKIRKKMKKNTPITRAQMVIMKDNKQEWEDFKKMFEPIVDTIAYGDYMDYNTSKRPEDFLIEKKNGKDDKRFCCPQIWQRMFIHPDGVVTPCCFDAKRELKMGDINKETVEQVWNGKKYNELRKLHRSGEFFKNDTCRNCALANYKPN
jgi:radical SAM protein with 4Fe4S-binding SPASM domain